MAKDRMNDLQKTTSWPRVSYRRLTRQHLNDEGQSAGNNGTIQFTTIAVDNEHNLTEFLAQSDLIRLLIDKIEELAQEVKQIHKKMLEPMANPKLGQELDDKTADIKKLAYDISTKLKRMEQIQENQDGTDKGNAQSRMKETQIFNITRHFRDVMDQYNQEFVLHRERCKNAIVRELEITGTKKSDDEIEEMLRNGFSGLSYIPILVDVEKARQAANEIQARQRDIAKLENSLKELHDMFVDLAFLVAAQGEMINNIEHSVAKATEYVGYAVIELKPPKPSCLDAIKKKLCICIIIIAVVVILILIIGAYFKIQNKIRER